MKTKTILGISFAAVFATAMIFSTSVLATGSHLDISDQDTKYQVDNKGVGKLLIHTHGKIPTDGSAGAFGYGVVTGATEDGPENVLALTSHKCVSDHPLQGNASNEDCPDPLGVLTLLTNGAVVDEDHDGPDMHAHILDLMAVVDTSSCSNVSGVGGLEVDIPRTLAGLDLPGNPFSGDATDYPNNLVAGADGVGYDIKVVGPNLQVRDIPSSDLYDDEAIAIVSFGIVALDDGSLTDANDGIVDRICLT